MKNIRGLIAILAVVVMLTFSVTLSASPPQGKTSVNKAQATASGANTSATNVTASTDVLNWNTSENVISDTSTVTPARETHQEAVGRATNSVAIPKHKITPNLDDLHVIDIFPRNNEYDLEFLNGTTAVYIGNRERG